jgi:hypothetical protein
MVPDRRKGVSDRRRGSGVLEFALACLLIALIVAGISITFALTNRVDITDLEQVQADQQEGRRVGIAAICSVEKALIDEGAAVILEGRGDQPSAELAAKSYKTGVVRRAREEARDLGVGELPELNEQTGSIDCRAFARRAKATPTPTTTPP